MSDHKQALVTYNESLALYARHVGKNHPTVMHTMHSVGCIHLELKQWKEAMGCFGECLALLKRSTGYDEVRMNENNGAAILPRNDLISPAANAEIATALKCLGVTRMHLGEYDAAFDSLSKSLERMILSLRASGNQKLR
jgi:tetratricopeptide (TPR) repeat protein